MLDNINACRARAPERSRRLASVVGTGVRRAPGSLHGVYCFICAQGRRERRCGDQVSEADGVRGQPTGIPR